MKSIIPVILWLLLLVPLSGLAHAPGQSYIFLRIYEDAIGGHVEITTDHLNTALDLDLERGMTVEELRPYLPRIQAYVLENVAFSSDAGAHAVRFIDEETDLMVSPGLGEYVQLHFLLEGIQEIPESLDIRFEVLFEKEPTHRNLLVIAYNWKAGVFNNEAMVSLIFSPDDAKQNLPLTGSSVMRGFWAMIKMGIWHIWIGIDHILFLLALVLPSVVRRSFGGNEVRFSSPPTAGVAAAPVGLAASLNAWTPVANFKSALIYVIKIVTLFTVAHTITLSLAALGVVDLPSRLVESVIALSIALAAYHNIKPIFGRRDWIIAFGFGLFHGFGFASVLGEIGLSGEYMVLSLLGFNLGVEIGQVAIICLIFPILYFLRKSDAYPKILVYGSMLLIVIALYWFTERVFEVDLPLDDFIQRVINKIMWITGMQ